MRMSLLIPGVICSNLLLTTAAEANCATAFCSVNTGAESLGIGTGHEKKLAVDLRYEFIKQDQQRSGSSEVNGRSNRDDEIEQRTLNRNWLLGVDYAFDASWGVSTQLPVVSRSHEHLHAPHGHTPELEAWSFNETGDLRVLGRYQFTRNPFETSSAGVNFGLQLPTGRTTVANAGGTRAERSLQPGTGSTDIVLGAFYNAPMGSASRGFIQALWQKPVASHNNYTPGARYSLDVGMRYAASDRLSLLLQLNTLQRERDQGANANPHDSGGTFINISPGARYALTPDLDIYGFFQQPVYQHVNGVQLTADWSVIAGISQRF